MNRECSSTAWERYRDSRCRIAAVGMVTVLGDSNEAVFERAAEACVTRFRREGGLVPGAEVLVGRVHEELEEPPERLARFRFRNCRLLLSAVRSIEPQIAAAVERYGAGRIGVVMGSSTAGIAVNEETVELLYNDPGAVRHNSHLLQEMISVSELPAAYAGLGGPFYTISTACSSSAKVIAAARRLMRTGICDAVVVGGADTLSKLTVNGFYSLGLLSDAPCCPFSRNRNGIVIGEGAAAMLLTSEDGGIQVLGVGESSDAYHFSAPDPSGGGAEAAMRAALTQASVRADDVFYLNLHGTGTPPNDKMEAEAVARLFPAELLCSSTKPLTGHLLGASGAAEIGISALFAGQPGKEILLPPHYWDGCFDPDLPKLAFVEAGRRYARPELIVCMSNSFAFGGSNASVVIAHAQ